MIGNFLHAIGGGGLLVLVLFIWLYRNEGRGATRGKNGKGRQDTALTRMSTGQRPRGKPGGKRR